MRPSTFLTLIPVFIYWAVIGFVLSLLTLKVHPAVVGGLLLIAAGALVGRFALPASRGDLHAGFFDPQGYRDSGELIHYGLRYLALTVIWAVPAGGLAYLGAQGAGAEMMGGGMASLFSMGWRGAIFLVVFVIAFAGPVLSFFVAAITSSIGELVRPDPWLWLVVTRRRDLIVFLSSAMGGLLVFTMLYAVPLGLVIIVLASMSPELAIVAVGVLYFAPAAASPVLVGRLIGAFVVGEDPLDGDEAPARTLVLDAVGGESEPQVTSSGSASSSGTSVSLSAMPSTLRAGVVITRVQKISPSQMPDALFSVKAKLDARPDDLEAHFEYMLLLRRNRQVEEFQQVAQKAISLALDKGDGKAAIVIFRSLQKYRDCLKQDTRVMRELKGLFQETTQYADLAWSELSLGDLAGSELERRLIEIAESASQAGKSEDALAIYNLLLETFPGSNFKEFVEKAAGAERAKLQ